MHSLASPQAGAPPEDGLFISINPPFIHSSCLLEEGFHTTSRRRGARRRARSRGMTRSGHALSKRTIQVVPYASCIYIAYRVHPASRVPSRVCPTQATGPSCQGCVRRWGDREGCALCGQHKGHHRQGHPPKACTTQVAPLKMTQRNTNKVSRGMSTIHIPEG